MDKAAAFVFLDDLARLIAKESPKGTAMEREVRRTVAAAKRWAGRFDLVQFLVHNIVVKKVNIHDAKTNLSRYLSALTPGEPLVLCNRNQPVAELRKLRTKEVRKPRIGAARGEFEVPDSFFEPLPDEILKAFNGKLR